MKDRLLKFMNKEQLSSARFAETIGVQPSSVSHILSGRNKPGFDFITKILASYPSLNAEWLIMGKGTMFKSDPEQRDLFSYNYNREIDAGAPANQEQNHADRHEMSEKDQSTDEDTGILDTFVNQKQTPGDHISKSGINPDVTSVTGSRKIEKIVILYSDQTFSEYSPAR
jgi:transcriptional regulator with XRE-family HTH domain